MARYVGIDPSTKTGIVVLDEDGEVWEAVEIEKDGKDPARMSGLIRAVMGYVCDQDIVAVEGFGFAGQSGFLLGGIGWGIRMDMFNRRIRYVEVAPNALKKFGSGVGTTKKDELGVAIYKRWGFEHKSDNVRDAYVLAQIARAIHEPVKLVTTQRDVINVIKNPPIKQPKKRKVV